MICRKYQISSMQLRRLLLGHWSFFFGELFCKVIYNAIQHSSIKDPKKKEKGNKIVRLYCISIAWILCGCTVLLYIGGYSHAPNELVYGVDIKHQIRWCGILQVFPWVLAFSICSKNNSIQNTNLMFMNKEWYNACVVLWILITWNIK